MLTNRPAWRRGCHALLNAAQQQDTASALLTPSPHMKGSRASQTATTSKLKTFLTIQVGTIKKALCFATHLLRWD